MLKVHIHNNKSSKLKHIQSSRYQCTQMSYTQQDTVEDIMEVVMDMLTHITCRFIMLLLLIIMVEDITCLFIMEEVITVVVIMRLTVVIMDIKLLEELYLSSLPSLSSLLLLLLHEDESELLLI